MDLNRHTECESQALLRRELHFISRSGERHGSTGTCADGKPDRRAAATADYRSDHGTSDCRATDPSRVPSARPLGFDRECVALDRHRTSFSVERRDAQRQPCET